MSISQEPSAHLASLVPSQGTERTSGMISGISLPQGQQETGPDAESSSKFMSGEALWKRRRRDTNDPEVMSNGSDSTIEIPEVKYQVVGAHCKKLDTQGCVKVVQKNE
jgi:hypothetical protein